MDAVLTPYPRDQTIAFAPNKQNRNKIPKKNISKFISNPSEKFDTYAGLLNPPPHPQALSSSSFSYQINQQPPLLPLPAVSPIQHRTHDLCPSLRNRKNKTRDMSLTPKKSTKPSMRDEVKKRATTQSISEFLIPKHLPVDPVDFTSLSRSTTMTGNGFGTVSTEKIGMLTGSAFNLSPPPSSLPLPKFSVRSKLSCNTETAGVDTGATDNLRRLLRLL